MLVVPEVGVADAAECTSIRSDLVVKPPSIVHNTGSGGADGFVEFAASALNRSNKLRGRRSSSRKILSNEPLSHAHTEKFPSRCPGETRAQGTVIAGDRASHY